ncbi:hypothetical protein ACNKHP_19020 [Shigella boydii]
MRLGRRKISPFVCGIHQRIRYITPPFTKALFTYVKSGSTPFVRRHMGGTRDEKSPVGSSFYDSLWQTLKADVSISVTELGSLLDHTGLHLKSGRVHRGWTFARNRVISLPTGIHA